MYLNISMYEFQPIKFLMSKKRNGKKLEAKEVILLNSFGEQYEISYYLS